MVVAVAALGIQAARGNTVVSGQSSAATTRDAQLDDSFYRCLDVQVRTLVRPGQTVSLGGGNLADVVTFLKAVGSWVTVADPASAADVSLSLRDRTGLPGSCLGTVVVGSTRAAGGGTVVRVGTGARVPGHGPPPAPPL
jgi:hypothetical protein